MLLSEWTCFVLSREKGATRLAVLDNFHKIMIVTRMLVDLLA